MKRFIWIAVVIFWARCASSTDESLNTSSVMVDLGDGNQAAIDSYNNFDASRCGNATSAVLAFKKFDGGQRNATQDGADELVRTSEPVVAEIDRQAGESTEEPQELGTEDQGIDQPVDQDQNVAAIEPVSQPGTTQPQQTGLSLQGGSEVDVDVVDVDGESTCVIRAPVNLHTPAIARRVAEQGVIRNFYMTGQRSGQGYVEAGAINEIGTEGTEFYNADGSVASQRNRSNRVEESAPYQQQVLSSFNQRAIADATGIRAANGPRDTNTYICNAVNYVLSQQGELNYLPGLTFQPLQQPVRTGFVHVSSDASSEEVARTMRQILASDREAQRREAH